MNQVIFEQEIEKESGKKVISVSAKTRKGIEEFESYVKKMFMNQSLSFNDEVFLTNIRQKNALEEAVQSLELVQKSIEEQMPEDFYSIDLMNAYTCVSSVIGESVDEDLVNEIFSKFCMGK